MEHLTTTRAERATRTGRPPPLPRIHPTMPTLKQVENPQKEGRMVLAVQTLRKSQIPSIRNATRLYDVPQPFSVEDAFHA